MFNPFKTKTTTPPPPPPPNNTPPLSPTTTKTPTTTTSKTTPPLSSTTTKTPTTISKTTPSLSPTTTKSPTTTTSKTTPTSSMSSPKSSTTTTTKNVRIDNTKESEYFKQKAADAKKQEEDKLKNLSTEEIANLEKEEHEKMIHNKKKLKHSISLGKTNTNTKALSTGGRGGRGGRGGTGRGTSTTTAGRGGTTTKSPTSLSSPTVAPGAPVSNNTLTKAPVSPPPGITTTSTSSAAPAPAPAPARKASVRKSGVTPPPPPAISTSPKSPTSTATARKGSIRKSGVTPPPPPAISTSPKSPTATSTSTARKSGSIRKSGVTPPPPPAISTSPKSPISTARNSIRKSGVAPSPPPAIPTSPKSPTALTSTTTSKKTKTPVAPAPPASNNTLKKAPVPPPQGVTTISTTKPSPPPASNNTLKKAPVPPAQGVTTISTTKPSPPPASNNTLKKAPVPPAQGVTTISTTKLSAPPASNNKPSAPPASNNKFSMTGKESFVNPLRDGLEDITPPSSLKELAQLRNNMMSQQQKSEVADGSTITAVTASGDTVAKEEVVANEDKDNDKDKEKDKEVVDVKPITDEKGEEKVQDKGSAMEVEQKSVDNQEDITPPSSLKELAQLRNSMMSQQQKPTMTVVTVNGGGKSFSGSISMNSGKMVQSSQGGSTVVNAELTKAQASVKSDDVVDKVETAVTQTTPPPPPPPTKRKSSIRKKSLRSSEDLQALGLAISENKDIENNESPPPQQVNKADSNQIPSPPPSPPMKSFMSNKLWDNTNEGSVKDDKKEVLQSNVGDNQKLSYEQMKLQALQKISTLSDINEYEEKKAEKDKAEQAKKREYEEKEKQRLQHQKKQWRNGNVKKFQGEKKSIRKSTLQDFDISSQFIESLQFESSKKMNSVVASEKSSTDFVLPDMFEDYNTSNASKEVIELLDERDLLQKKVANELKQLKLRKAILDRTTAQTEQDHTKIFKKLSQMRKIFFEIAKKRDYIENLTEDEYMELEHHERTDYLNFTKKSCDWEMKTNKNIEKNSNTGLSIDGIFYDLSDLENHLNWMNKEKNQLRKRFTNAHTGVEEIRKVKQNLNEEILDLNKSIKTNNEKDARIISELNLTIKLLNGELKDTQDGLKKTSIYDDDANEDKESWKKAVVDRIWQMEEKKWKSSIESVKKAGDSKIEELKKVANEKCEELSISLGNKYKTEYDTALKTLKERTNAESRHADIVYRKLQALKKTVIDAKEKAANKTRKYVSDEVINADEIVTEDKELELLKLKRKVHKKWKRLDVQPHHCIAFLQNIEDISPYDEAIFTMYEKKGDELQSRANAIQLINRRITMVNQLKSVGEFLKIWLTSGDTIMNNLEKRKIKFSNNKLAIEVLKDSGLDIVRELSTTNPLSNHPLSQEEITKRIRRIASEIMIDIVEVTKDSIENITYYENKYDKDITIGGKRIVDQLRRSLPKGGNIIV